MIYFVQAQSGEIKIGSTNHWARRFAALRYDADGPLRCLALIDGDMADERALHKRFADYRIHGEWFSPAPDVLAFIGGETSSAEWLPKPVERPRGGRLVSGSKTVIGRLRDGGTQKVMSRKLGISQAYLSQLVTGRREPSLGQLVAIADTFGVSDRELGASAREMARGDAFAPSAPDEAVA
jgi:hypothetical protein